MGANTAKHGLDDIQELIGGRERGRTLVCLFYRKGSEREFARAQDDIEMRRAAVDRLATIIASANQHEDAQANVVEAAELKPLSKRSRLNRRNYVFEQLGRAFRERSADVVDAPLPVEMLCLVLKLASADPRPALDAPTEPPNLRSSAATRSRG